MEDSRLLAVDDLDLDPIVASNRPAPLQQDDSEFFGGNVNLGVDVENTFDQQGLPKPFIPQESSAMVESKSSTVTTAETTPVFSSTATSSASPSKIVMTHKSEVSSTRSPSGSVSGTTNPISTAPQSPSRLHPVAPSVAPEYFRLPTRKMVDPLSFTTISNDTKIEDSISLFYSTVAAAVRPKRNLVSLPAALESPDAYQFLRNHGRLVAQLARNDLIACHPIQIQDCNNLWVIRWKAMAKLKLYDQIELEMEKTKIGEWVLYDFAKYDDIFPNQTGSMLSFELLLFYCKVATLKGNHYESIFRLYKLLYASSETRYKLNKEEIEVVVLEIANVLLRIPDYQLASKLLEDFVTRVPQNSKYWAALGRVQLQMGLVEAAKFSFETVEEILGIPKAEDGNHVFDLQSEIPRPDLILSNRGFLMFVAEKYEIAQEYFTRLIELYPLSPDAVNNLALCYLYDGDVGKAARTIESFIAKNGRLGASNAQLVSNLKSLYDLADPSNLRKSATLKLLIPEIGDDFDSTFIKA